MSAPPILLAHGAAEPGDAWLDAASILALAVLAAGYFRGVHEIWARVGPGAVLSRASVVSFAVGVALLGASSQGPLHLVAQGSLAGHMTQHMAIWVAGLLLAAARAGLPLALAAPHRVRRWLARQRTRGLGGWLRRPLHAALIAAGAQTITLWTWHLPGPFEVATHSPPLHLVEHATFVAASWLMWSTVVRADRAPRLGGAAFLVLFATGMAATGLGAVLTFAPAPIYQPTAYGVAGHPALSDQQLAGLVMWIPMDVVVLAVAVVLFLRWLAALERSRPADRGRRPVAEESGVPR